MSYLLILKALIKTYAKTYVETTIYRILANVSSIEEMAW